MTLLKLELKQYVGGRGRKFLTAEGATGGSIELIDNIDYGTRK